MTTKKDLEKLAENRLAAALHLFRGERYAAAYYLAGYAVELAIKACIANFFQAKVIPDKTFVDKIYSHKLDVLLGLAGIKQDLDNEMKNNASLGAAWGVASKWSEASRYEIWDQFSARISSKLWEIKIMGYCNG